MKVFAQNFFKFSYKLSLFEWIMVMAVAISPIIFIRFVSMFYVGLVVLGLMSGFAAVATWDYRHTKYKKQRAQKAQHYMLAGMCMVIGFFAAAVYLIG